MTKSQVRAALPAPCVGQTSPGSKLSLPETVCLGCPVLSPHCSYCTGYFQGRISTGKTEYIFMENIQFKPRIHVMTPLPVVPVSPVWAGHDLGKCWAKFPASAPAGDTSLTLWTWEHSDEEEVQRGHRPHTNMGGVWWSRGKFPPGVSHTRSQVVNHNDLSQR